MSMRLSRNGKLAAIVGCTLLLSACANDMSDLQQFVQQEKSKKPGPIEPLPQIKPYESFTYEAQNLRSPFVPDSPQQQTAETTEATGSSNGLKPDTNRNKEYLESFPLDALDMKGTLQMRGNLYALVSDPEGAVHRVQVGNYLGQNYGQIVAITETEIRLTEIIPDGLGGWMERRAAIGLNEE
ncbi:MAG: pilus assembly protein PilP [Gammaproteobacteria bacterium]|nr:pilus assembly protein PilP [Gammaproteobacteria bacterium]